MKSQSRLSYSSVVRATSGSRTLQAKAAPSRNGKAEAVGAAATSAKAATATIREPKASRTKTLANDPCELRRAGLVLTGATLKGTTLKGKALKGKALNGKASTGTSSSSTSSRSTRTGQEKKSGQTLNGAAKPHGKSTRPSSDKTAGDKAAGKAARAKASATGTKAGVKGAAMEAAQRRGATQLARTAPQKASARAAVVGQPTVQRPVTRKSASSSRDVAEKPDVSVKSPVVKTPVIKPMATKISITVLPAGYRPSDSEPFMGDLQRLYFKKKLAAWRDEILHSTRETLQSLHEDQAHYADIADRATSESDKALELRARDRQRKLIAKIEAAMERIDRGTYGYCDETGEPIAVKRLDARPIATLSIEAQERHERRERVYRDD